jgi:glucosamine 6-phosphate synthetase-like amidotransferase/phosphosugar isomerase protein
MVRECSLAYVTRAGVEIGVASTKAFTTQLAGLFLGRGMHYPIALEGALKLKEISYIHAEAYPAGELKHGPLALVTSDMPVVTVAPNDALLEKLKSNLHEVRARGGVLYVLADGDTHIDSAEGLHVIRMPEHYGALSPLLHVVPLQLLAYHTACACGTDVDKPSRLLKYLPTTGKLALAMVIYPLAASEKWLVGVSTGSTFCHKRHQNSISAAC